MGGVHSILKRSVLATQIHRIHMRSNEFDQRQALLVSSRSTYFLDSLDKSRTPLRRRHALYQYIGRSCLLQRGNRAG